MKIAKMITTKLQVAAALLALLGAASLGAPRTAMAQHEVEFPQRHRLMEVPQLRLDAQQEHDLKLLEVRLDLARDLRLLDVELPAEPPPPAPSQIPPSMVHGFQDENAMDDIVLVPIWRF